MCVWGPMQSQVVSTKVIYLVDISLVFRELDSWLWCEKFPIFGVRSVMNKTAVVRKTLRVQGATGHIYPQDADAVFCPPVPARFSHMQNTLKNKGCDCLRTGCTSVSDRASFLQYLQGSVPRRYGFKACTWSSTGQVWHQF